MEKYDRVAGIDPDVGRSGVGVVHVKARKAEMMALPFPLLLDYLRGLREWMDGSGGKALVVVEAGWLNRSNWHIKGRDGKTVSAAIGASTGRNHETGRKIVEMARYYGLETVEAKPLRKVWRGSGGKITHGELSVVVGGLDVKRSNQEERDALLLAWVHAGLPVKG